MKFQREWLLLIGSLLIIAALYNHYMGHSAYLVEIVFIAVGGVIALYSLLGPHRMIDETQPGLLFSMLSRIIERKHAAVLLPAFGFLLILIWSTWKLFVMHTADLRMEDFMVTLFGLSLILYLSGPSEFTNQKDFAVLYLMFLTIVFAGIWPAYRIITGESESRVNMYSEYYMITSPVVFLVSIIGVDASAVLNTSGHGLSNIIEYEYKGHMLRLGIGTGCSGLYSAGLFFSAFLAFVLVRYRKVDWYTAGALAVGLGVTWLSNIIRMVVTVLVGSVYGSPALALFHSYFGVLVFVALIGGFWFIIVKWLDRKEKTNPPFEEKSLAEVPDLEAQAKTG